MEYRSLLHAESSNSKNVHGVAIYWAVDGSRHYFRNFIGKLPYISVRPILFFENTESVWYDITIRAEEIEFFICSAYIKFLSQVVRNASTTSLQFRV